MTVPCHLSSNNCAPVPSVNVHVELQNEGLVTMKVPRGPSGSEACRPNCCAVVRLNAGRGSLGAGMDPAAAAVQALCRALCRARSNPRHATLLGGPGKPTGAHSRRFVCTHCYGKDGVGALTRQGKALRASESCWATHSLNSYYRLLGVLRVTVQNRGKISS